MDVHGDASFFFLITPVSKGALDVFSMANIAKLKFKQPAINASVLNSFELVNISILFQVTEDRWIKPMFFLVQHSVTPSSQ